MCNYHVANICLQHAKPPKREVSAEDCHPQTKRGKQDYTKRKHSLSLNVKLNPFKHGQGCWQICIPIYNPTLCTWEYLALLSWCSCYINCSYIIVSGTHTECILVAVVMKQYTSHKNTVTKVLHFSNLLPEPGVILDVGSVVAMVVKEVVVISGPLFWRSNECHC